MSLLKHALTSGLPTEAATGGSDNLVSCDKEYLLPSQGDITALDALQTRAQEEATAALASQIGFGDNPGGAWRQTAEFIAQSDAIEEAFVKVRNVATASEDEESASWKWTARTAGTSFAREFRTHGDVKKVATWVNIEATDPDNMRVVYRTYHVQSSCYDRSGEWETHLYRDRNELFL